jgi:hypothetical protein
MEIFKQLAQSEGGTLLTSKYLQLAGRTMSGALNITVNTANQIVLTNSTSIRFFNGIAAN